MDFADFNDIINQDFRGFVTVETLQQSACADIPDEPGVYFILWPLSETPTFLPENIGGHFKGKNPTVTIRNLEKKWVNGAKIIYIGKAGSVASKATLSQRLYTYMKFGMGNPVAHWGGRYIWQIKQWRSLQVCWKITEGHEAPILESQLIREFAEQYGKRPFANLRN
ncbi:MAG: hypothetical protein R6X32_13120 [Chloroflexota bacterium]